MASYESTNMLSSSSMRDEGALYAPDHNSDDGFERLDQGHNLSRLSVSTSSMYTNEEEEDDDDVGFNYDGGHEMSRLAIVSFDGEEKLSDVEKEVKFKTLELSSDSDEEACYYSLPATPTRRRNRGGCMNEKLTTAAKEYASENEAQKGINITRQNPRKNLRERRIVRERWLDIKSKKRVESEGYVGMSQDNNCSNDGHCHSGCGESDGGGSGGVVVIARAKGGKRPLCMDLDEVKACRDLGFELEHDRVLEMPGTVSLSGSGSTLDTSSGGNSPSPNWRISSPGDDPRDVKARLKAWAQAVALASASRHSGI